MGGFFFLALVAMIGTIVVRRPAGSHVQTSIPSQVAARHYPQPKPVEEKEEPRMLHLPGGLSIEAAEDEMYEPDPFTDEGAA
jgi:hypothetical protein